MEEQGQTAGTVVMTDLEAERLVQDAPEIVRSEVLDTLARNCYKCPAKSGNGSGVIDEGAVVFDEKSRRYIVAWLCKPCGQKSKRPVLAAETLLAMVDKLNKERDERIAATDAARAENAKKLEAASAVWWDIANGRVKVRFAVKADEAGNPLCGMPDCSYCAGKGPAKAFVVVRTAKGWEHIGLCIHQGAARRESRVPWSRIPWGSREICEAEAKKRQDAVDYFVALWVGKAERPTFIVDEKGRIFCGVSGCSCKEPVRFGLVSEKNLNKVGLCLPHTIAGRDANRQGTGFFIDALPDCDRHLHALERTVAQFAHRLDRAAWASREHGPSAKPAKPVAEKKATEPKPPVPVVVSEDDLAAAVTRGPVSLQEAAAAGDPAALFVLRHNAQSHATCGAKRKGGGKKDGDKDKGGKPGKGGRK